MKQIFYNCCSLDHLLSGVQINEAKKAAKEGHEVFFTYCYGVLSKCQVNSTGNPLICKLCKSNSKNVLQQLPKSVKLLPLKKVSRKLSNLLEFEFPFESIQELKQINYKGVAIGYGALSYYISCTRNHVPELNSAFKKFVYDIFSMSIDMIDQGQELINLVKPDKIQLFNGRQFQTRPWMDLALFNKVNFDCNEVKYDFVHNTGWKIVKFENTLPHDLKNAYNRSIITWNNTKLTNEEKFTLGKSFFEKRRIGVPAGDKVYTSNQDKHSLPEGFDRSKRNITIFNSSEDEFAALGADFENNRMFESQLSGIKFILEQFKTNTEFIFYVRVHPNLIGIPYAYHTDIYKMVSEFPNLRVIPADSKVSTYSLIDYSEKVIVFGSTTGVEAAYWNKPVILLGVSFYQYHNICYTPEDKSGVKELILSDLKPKDILGAVIYGHYILDCSVMAKKPEYIDINPPEITSIGHKYKLNKQALISSFNWVNNLISIALNKGLFDKFYFTKDKL
jgi:hypothetical protein